MDIPSEVITAFPQSADLLLGFSRRHADDAVLADIAGADYGYMAAEMLGALRQIRDTGVIPNPIPGQLSEVLSLTRFCDPDKPNPPPFAPGPTGKTGHMARLFACAVLLRADAQTAFPSDTTPDSTLAQCLASAKVIGDEASIALGSFISWRLLESFWRVEDRLLLILGLLIVAARLRAGRFTDQALRLVAEWVFAEEALLRRELPFDPSDPMPVAFSLQAGFWNPLCSELKSQAATIQNEEIRTNITLCAQLLEPD